MDLKANQENTKRRKSLTKADIVWNDSENWNCTRSATHGMYSAIRGHFEGYEGNAALCNIKYGIGEGDGYLPIDEVPNNSDYQSACKSCKKIFDKLPD